MFMGILKGMILFVNWCLMNYCMLLNRYVYLIWYI